MTGASNLLLGTQLLGREWFLSGCCAATGDQWLHLHTEVSRDPPAQFTDTDKYFIPQCATKLFIVKKHGEENSSKRHYRRFRTGVNYTIQVKRKYYYRSFGHALCLFFKGICGYFGRGHGRSRGEHGKQLEAGARLGPVQQRTLPCQGVSGRPKQASCERDILHKIQFWRPAVI